MPHFNLIALAFLLLPMVAAALKRRGQGQPERAPPPPSPPVLAEAEDAERTRRVREEIQRRIAARRGQPGRTGPETEPEPARSLRRLLQPAAPAVPSLDPFGGPGRGLWSRVEEPPVEPVPAKAPAPPPLAPAIVMPLRAAAPPPAPETDSPHPWLGDLRDRPNLRKLVVLREVLDAPVGLRGGPPLSPRV